MTGDLILRVRHEAPVLFAPTSGRWMACDVLLSAVAIRPAAADAVPVTVPGRMCRRLLHRVGDRLHDRVSNTLMSGPPAFDPYPGGPGWALCLTAAKPPPALWIPPLKAMIPPILLNGSRARKGAVESLRDMAEANLARFAAEDLLHDGADLLVACDPPLITCVSGGAVIHTTGRAIDFTHMPLLPASAPRGDAFAEWIAASGLFAPADSVRRLADACLTSLDGVADRHEDIAHVANTLPMFLAARAGYVRAHGDTPRRREIVAKANAVLSPWLCRASMGLLPREEWGRVLADCRAVASDFRDLNIARTYRAAYERVVDYIDRFAMPNLPDIPIPAEDTRGLLALAH